VPRLCAIALVGLALAASDPPPPPVRLDVVVTSGSGVPILDLRPADFELRENGVVRPISAVELRTTPRVSPVAAAPITSVDDERRAAATPGTRVFAFMLDEFHVSPGQATERVRASLARFIDTSLAPGDLAVAIKPLDAVSKAQFSRDRAALRSSVATFDGRKGDYTPRSAFESQYIGHAPATIDAARAQIVSAALRDVGLRLGELGADRGVVVVVSEGFARRPSVRQVRVPDIQGFVRAASRFHVAVYTFNPADAPPEADSDPAIVMLASLATDTGGQALLDGRQFDDGLRRMAIDLDGYYAITYQPAQADGKFHPIQVVARRANARVRARPGYWASLGSELRALMEVPSMPVVRRALRRSTSVNIWTGVSRAADGASRLTVTWEPRGTARATTVTVKAATQDGRTLFEGPLAPVGSSGGGTATRATFDVPPGRIQLDMSVLSIAGGTIDTDVRDVDVADLSRRGDGPFILTPEIVRGRTTPEFRAEASDPLASPTPARLFTRGDRLLITVPVWSPATAPIRVGATIANAMGGVMRTLDPVEGSDALRPRFEIPLAWLAPGEYQFIFSAKNDKAEVKESVRFAVR